MQWHVRYYIGVFLFIKLEVQLFSANVLCHSFMCFSREHAWNSRQDVLKVINNFDDQTACITSRVHYCKVEKKSQLFSLK